MDRDDREVRNPTKPARVLDWKGWLRKVSAYLMLDDDSQDMRDLVEDMGIKDLYDAGVTPEEAAGDIADELGLVGKDALMESSTSLAEQKLAALKRGERIITNDEQMDDMTKLDSDLMTQVRSLPNPKRLGLKDVYIAWIGGPTPPAKTEVKESAPTCQDCGKPLDEEDIELSKGDKPMCGWCRERACPKCGAVDEPCACDSETPMVQDMEEETMTSAKTTLRRILSEATKSLGLSSLRQMYKSQGLFEFWIAGPDEDGQYELVGGGDYPESSVLAGQYHTVRYLDTMDSLDEAKVKYPGVDVEGDRPNVKATVPDAPPEGFDPADAGERWDEE